MRRLTLTAADLIAVLIGALAGTLIALGILDAWLQRHTA